MTVTRISSAHARVADSTAVSRLLDEVPEAEDISGQLCRPFFARRWHQATQRSFWIGSDGDTAVCLTLTGLDVDEVLAIWIAFDGYRAQPGFSLSAGSLSAIIEAELGLVAGFET